MKRPKLGAAGDSSTTPSGLAHSNPAATASSKSRQSVTPPKPTAWICVAWIWAVSIWAAWIWAVSIWAAWIWAVSIWALLIWALLIWALMRGPLSGRVRT